MDGTIPYMINDLLNDWDNTKQNKTKQHDTVNTTYRNIIQHNTTQNNITYLDTQIHITSHFPPLYCFLPRRTGNVTHGLGTTHRSTEERIVRKYRTAQ